jgi:hypothetical protein
MRTADSIEATAESQADSQVATSGKKPKKTPSEVAAGRARRLANLVAPWNSQTAPKSCGRPKKDISQEIARQVFENNPELLYKAYVKALAKGQAFAFQVLSDRAYGKLVEKRIVADGGQQDFAGEDESSLNERIARIEQDLGLAGAIDEAGRIGSAQAGKNPTNGKAETTDLLPR